jgi:hypothetical protein
LKGGAFLPILVAGATPFILVGLIVFGSTLGLVAWKPPLLWTNQFGNPNMTSDIASAVADYDGLYVGGYLNYTYLNGTPFLREYNTVGGIAWTNYVKGASGLIHGISIGSDGVYFLQEENTNETFQKFGFNGSEIWGQLMDQGISLSTTSSTLNAVYATGCSDHPITNQTFIISRPNSTCISFVREYDPRGEVVWTSEYSNSVSVQGMVAAASGVYTLASPILVAYSLNGQKLWSLSLSPGGFGIGPSSVSADSTGVYVSGTLGPLRQPSGFLTKYNFNGSTVWNVTFDSSDESGVEHALVSADSSGVYVSTVSGRGNDFVEKYDSNGHELWSFQTPVKAGYSESFLVAPMSGGFYLAGSTHGEQALVQAFSASPSLVFFGANPPFSFILLGALIAIAILSIFVLRKRYVKIMSTHPKSASPDRYRKPSQALSRLKMAGHWWSCLDY